MSFFKITKKLNILRGGFNDYIADYYRYLNGKIVTIELFNLIFPMILFASGFTCPLGPKAVKKIGNFRIFFGIVGCVYACIPLIASFVKNYIGFIVLYGMGKHLLNIIFLKKLKYKYI